MLGSLERFFGVMLEHFAGDLPLWLAPEQARVLPVVGQVPRRRARAGAASSRAAGLRVEVDERNEKLGAKIRDGEMVKVPVLLIVGPARPRPAAPPCAVRHRGDLGSRRAARIATI